MELEVLRYVKRLAVAVCLVALGSGVSACYSGWPGRSFNPLMPGQSAGIEGRWVDASGITSSFRNGIFETRSADTYEKLAEGNYALRGDNSIEIEMRSLVRGTVSRVNCSFANTSSLFCSSENGQKFALTRI